MTLERDQIFDLLDIGDLHSSHLTLTNDQMSAAILTLATVIYSIHRSNKENQED